MFLKISWISQENAWVEVFLIKLFSCEIYKILKNTSFYRTTAAANSGMKYVKEEGRSLIYSQLHRKCLLIQYFMKFVQSWRNKHRNVAEIFLLFTFWSFFYYWCFYCWLWACFWLITIAELPFPRQQQESIRTRTLFCCFFVDIEQVHAR